MHACLLGIFFFTAEASPGCHGPAEAHRCTLQPAEVAPPGCREGSGTSLARRGTTSRSPPCSVVRVGSQGWTERCFLGQVLRWEVFVCQPLRTYDRPASPAQRRRPRMHAGLAPAPWPRAWGLVDVRPWPSSLGTRAGEEGAGVQVVQR